MQSKTGNCIWQDNDGNIRVNADIAFLELYPRVDNNQINQVSDKISDLIKDLSLKQFKKLPSSGSLNNCKGRWNEFSFFYSAHLSILENTNDLYLVKLGNESSLKFWEIYSELSRKSFEDFLREIGKKKIFVRCSTPDFVLIKRNILNSIPDYSDINFFSYLKDLYKQIINKCEPSDIISFISLKTSNRPDRRYQILYEANITKYASKYIHDSSCPLRFDAIGESNSSDSEVFSAPLLCDLKKIDVENFKLESKSVIHSAIDSDVNIYTLDDMNNYWKRFQ
jgi:Cfr10I/Bse634I restriction endonuclease